MTRDRSPDRLFMHDDQLELLGRSAEQETLASTADDARRAVYLERLRVMLPELREIEGFPVGTDEDILALSDPPYYTACPNPFLGEFIAEHGTPYDEATDDYHREPFAADVSEGKTNALYRAHGYHTKVPHLAVAPYILHYTDPGQVVLDGFCGSGMTGLAAQWCGLATPAARGAVGKGFGKSTGRLPMWGVRPAIMNDLSPAATFIAANFLEGFDLKGFASAARWLLDSVDQEFGWMYQTTHTDGRSARIEYTVWTEDFQCPGCGEIVSFLREALDADTKRVRESFPCPSCGTQLTKDGLVRTFETVVDRATGAPWRRVRLRPALISYEIDGHRYEKEPDSQDLALLSRVDSLPLPPEVPRSRFPIEHMSHGSRIAPKGFTNVHQFFLPRSAQSLAALWRGASTFPDVRTRHMLLFFAEQAIWGMSVLNRYQPIQQGRPGGSQVNRQLSGVYYIPSQIAEVSPRYNLGLRLNRLTDAFEGLGRSRGPFAVSTGDCARLGVTDHSVDYIFTDPPFGENIYYADLNFLVESWHRVVTNSDSEAIVDRGKGKSLVDYQHLMEDSFREYWRVLKPGRWMTVVFHNSSNAVWNAIQEAIQRARFVVADVRTMDKQQGSYRQVTSSAVKQDLVISAYKPRAGFEHRFSLEAGTEQGGWDFVRQHLEQLPVFVERGGVVEVVAERQDYLLFDRMVAFHIQRGVTIPLSAAPFYAGLRQRFPERDGMFFTELQAAQYDQRRLEAKDVEQLSVFVVDEKSAIAWLRSELGRHPETFQDLQPKFLRELQQSRFEALPELRDILEQSFLEDPASHRWRVPDPSMQADLGALRQRALLAEFASYQGGGTKLKRFRVEAVRAGFASLWAERDYAAIIQMAERLPDEVIQEDPALLMYYDNAVVRDGR